MAKNFNDKISQDRLSRYSYQLFEITKKERNFLILVVALTFLSGILAPFPAIAMWFGFALAGYSAIANDSIQTIGTFIASNNRIKWWYLWLFIGLIFVATVTYSWVMFDGDVSYQRLTLKGFSEAPSSFTFLQLSAPLVLLILTRLRMPVSTTFLLLNAFSTESGAIVSVLKKSLSGYIIAFVVAIIVWFLVGKLIKKYAKGKPAPYWRILQWVSSGALWSVWVMQDAANIAIFLPRSLNAWEFVAFTGFIFIGLGVLFFLKGDRIQKIVTEKAGVTDVRAATLVDMVYALLLFYFKTISVIPISTTWVFIGLLGGRELAISISKKRAKRRKKSLKSSFLMAGKDLKNAGIGLLVSLILALAINEKIREEFISFFF
jgi:hypothetical protein